MNAKSCPNCQQLVTAEAIFCGHCGQQFVQTPPPAVPLTPPPVPSPTPPAPPPQVLPNQPPPTTPAAQPHPHTAFNQQPTTNQQFAQADPPEPQKESSYLVMGGLFVVGLLITIIPPIFFNAVIYIIQFGFAIGLFQQARKAPDKNKALIGYLLTGLMIVLGIIAIFIAMNYGE